jgi:hypothetical protein
MLRPTSWVTTTRCTLSLSRVPRIRMRVASAAGVFAQITPDTGFKLSADVDEFYLTASRITPSWISGCCQPRPARDSSLECPRRGPLLFHHPRATSRESVVRTMPVAGCLLRPVRYCVTNEPEIGPFLHASYTREHDLPDMTRLIAAEVAYSGPC